MKNYKADEKNIDLIIQKLITKNYSFPVSSEDILKEMSTDKVTVLAARLDDDYDTWPRYLSGYAKLDNPIIAEENDIHVETDYVHFWFDIYSSHQIWNEMSYIRPFFLLSKPGLKKDIDDAVDAQVLIQNTVWGQNGIYKWMPTRSLSGDDLDRRLFVKQIQSVSRKYQWGQEIKKLQLRETKKRSKELQEDVMNDKGEKMAEVIVFNEKSRIVRHIITVNEPYDEVTVKSWYYDNYHKIDGDKFIYCATSKERNEIINALSKERCDNTNTNEELER